MGQESLLGKLVWIEMDQDRSAAKFSPRKGTVTHRYSKPFGKEAWLVELDPAPLFFSPLPRKLYQVILQYYDTNPHSLYLTFQSGVSYAEVLRLRRKHEPLGEILVKHETSRIGSALVYPYPKPEDSRLRIVRRNDVVS